MTLLVIGIIECILIPLAIIPNIDADPAIISIVFIVIIGLVNFLLGYRASKLESENNEANEKLTIPAQICIYSIFFAELFIISFMYHWAYVMFEEFMVYQRSPFMATFVTILVVACLFIPYAAYYYFRSVLQKDYQKYYNLKDKAIILASNLITVSLIGTSL
jgi:hypothetical protein